MLASNDNELLRHNQVARRHWGTLNAIKDFIKMGLWEAAHEAWEEMDHDTQKMLYKAPSRGGLLTTQERAIVKGVFEDWQYKRDMDSEDGRM